MAVKYSSTQRPHHRAPAGGAGADAWRSVHSRHGEREAAEGEVLAVGNGKLLDNGQRIAIDLKAGDRILFANTPGLRSSSTATST